MTRTDGLVPLGVQVRVGRRVCRAERERDVRVCGRWSPAHRRPELGRRCAEAGPDVEVALRPPVGGVGAARWPGCGPGALSMSGSERIRTLALTAPNSAIVLCTSAWQPAAPGGSHREQSGSVMRRALVAGVDRRPVHHGVAGHREAGGDVEPGDVAGAVDQGVDGGAQRGAALGLARASGLLPSGSDFIVCWASRLPSLTSTRYSLPAGRRLLREGRFGGRHRPCVQPQPRLVRARLRPRRSAGRRRRRAAGQDAVDVERPLGIVGRRDDRSR